MCILCVVQKWCRGVAAMVPWLVIPLILVWAFSQLLPEGFRFEVTSPRIACVSVLLLTLCWYEVVMPRLSAWKLRRDAHTRQRKRFAAIEMHKLRKMATRKCRNCSTPYRDQNPGGGRFMCCNCGHLSKRPVLEITASPPHSLSKTGTLCTRATWFSHPPNFTFWTKFFGGGTFVDDASLDGHHGGLSNKGEGVHFHQSKGDKARRKAEEKRHARLQKELLEEEERKQRLEVARLVDERRRLRDQKMEAENQCIRSLARQSENKIKRDAQKKPHQSQTNPPIQTEKKPEFHTKSENEKPDLQKTLTHHTLRSRNSEMKNAAKVANTGRGNGINPVNASLLSSSKALNGGTFFGNGAKVVPKLSNPGRYVDSIQTSPSGKSSYSNGHFSGNLTANGDDKLGLTTFPQPVTSEPQQRPTPKKSWQQLFARSPAPPPVSISNFANSLNHNPQANIESPYLTGQLSPSHPLSGQISFGQPLPFCLSPFPNVSRSVSPISSSAADSSFLVGESSYDFLSEDSDIYEDPCYVPDPLSLLGPVSESLDNFPLDLRPVNDTELRRSHSLKSACASVEANKPSPIEAPASRLRFVEGGNTNSCSYPSTPKSQNVNSLSLNESTNQHEQRTWQMWGTPQLGNDGFGFVGGSANWHLPLENNKLNHEDVVYPSSFLPTTSSPQRVRVENCQNGGTFGLGANDNDPWLQRTVLPLPGDGQSSFPPLSPRQDIFQSEAPDDIMKNSLASHPFESPPANCWSKTDSVVHGSEEDVVGGHSSLPRPPHVGGLFSSPDVQSVWSFN